MLKLFIINVFIVFLTISDFAGGYCAPTEKNVRVKAQWKGVRPRLLMDNKQISSLRVRLGSEPELRSAGLPINQPIPDFTASESVKLTPELAKLEKAAFYWYVTREEVYRKTVTAFLPLVEKILSNPVTLKTGPNAHDLNAGFTLRWLSLTYDWLQNSWPEEQLFSLRAALRLQAATVYTELQNYRNFTYDQNHGYIPVVGLGLAAFTLWEEDQRAQVWADYVHDYMTRSTKVLGSDGFYYEGPAYYSYAFEWQVLYAVVLLRLTGEDWTHRPVFRNLEKFVAHCTLPGRSAVFDFGDWGSFKGQKYYGIPWNQRTTLTGPNTTRMNLNPLLALDYYSSANHYRSSVIRWLLNGNSPELYFLGKRSYPFICDDSGMSGQSVSHYFNDSEAVFWRSSWSDPDATAVMFKCGPPHGHHALPLFIEYPYWRENSGHVHPDAGQFLIWSRGKFLAGDTGYTGKKYTREHNRLLVDGMGQWQDGCYHVYQNIDYNRLNALRLINVCFSSHLLAATAVLDSAYSPDLGIQKLRRHFLLVEGKWLLIQDEMLSSKSHKLSFIWHTDEKAVKDRNKRWNFINGRASATLFTLNSCSKELVEPAVVLAYGGVPEQGEMLQRGWRLELISDFAYKTELWNAVVLNPFSSKSVSAERISSTAVKLHDGKDEAILNIQPLSGGRIRWSYRINKGRTYSF